MQDIAVDLAFILLKVKNTPHLIISTIIFFIYLLVSNPSFTNRVSDAIIDVIDRFSLETTRMDFMNYKRSLDWRNFLEFGFGREVTVQGRLSFQGDSDLEGFFLSVFFWTI
ncbi:unnamed protein product [Rhizophagus irregularis]|nr:unnamed protein product [Rhizophagus irregularis]CAB4407496.1 unnamed protein product [Rhizophagus irregularis]